MSESQPFSEADKLLFRDSLVKFLTKEVHPYYEQWERDEIWPRDLWRKFGEAGFLCIDQPVQYGGYGASFELNCMV